MKTPTMIMMMMTAAEEMPAIRGTEKSEDDIIS